MAENFQSELDKLECPFTWGLSETKINDKTMNLKEKYKYHEDITFARYLLFCYIKINSGENAYEDLKETEQLIDELKSLTKQEVARHVLNATKANFLFKQGNLDELKQVLNNIKSINTDPISLGILNQFKASVWSQGDYDDIDKTDIVIKFAKLSTKYDTENACSHYLLGKTLRKDRRFKSVFSYPGEEESEHIKKAYELEKNPRFCALCATSLKESKHHDEALKMFHDIIKMEDLKKDTTVQLRIALAFTQAGHLADAKRCLDDVESIAPERSMFLHYKGLYLMKIKEYQEAKDVLLKAIENNDTNYGAEMSYIECMGFLKNNSELIPYLLKLKEKYSDSKTSREKEILINIAFCYYYFEKNLEESIKFFLLGFEIEEQQFSLQKFRCRITNKKLNLYRFLKQEFFPRVESDINKQNYSQETTSAFNQLKKKVCYQCPQHQTHYRKKY